VARRSTTRSSLLDDRRPNRQGCEDRVDQLLDPLRFSITKESPHAVASWPVLGENDLEPTSEREI